MGFHVESTETLPYGNGATGQSILIRAQDSAVGAARCQVAFLAAKAPFAPDNRPSAVVRIEPVDGSPSFDMKRVLGSDTDLGTTIGDRESFTVDCDEVSQAQFVASYVAIAK
jgi:hypothetical protein